MRHALVILALCLSSLAYGQVPGYQRGFLLTHAFSHGCLHREQACAALSAAGAAAPDLDGWGYAAVAEVVRPAAR